jgi:hypothetical protein
MAECFLEQLLDVIPEDEVRGFYFKGSSKKDWESPLDYVPEVSDVDMHLWFRDDDRWPVYLGTVSQALEVQKGVEERFRASVPQPLHTPRPQLIVMNKMMAELKDFVYSPRSTVTTLHGEEYPKGDYSDSYSIRRYDSHNLVENGMAVETLPLSVVDKPGRYLWGGLRNLTWRVSPVAPRVLHVSGLETEHAWSMNRTTSTAALRDGGFVGLADSYTEYYLSSWDYFLSGFTDSDAGRSAIEAAVRVLSEGERIGRGWLAANPEPAATAG